MTHSFGVLSWAHPVGLLLQQPATQSQSTSPNPGHRGRAPLCHPYFPGRAPKLKEGPQGGKEGELCLFCFYIFIKQNHQSQQAWFPELPLMTRSEQKHAQLPLPPTKHTQLPDPGKHQSRMNFRGAPGWLPAASSALPNPAI